MFLTIKSLISAYHLIIVFLGLVGHPSSTIQRLLQMLGPYKSSSLISLYQLNSYNRPYVPRGQPKFGQSWGTESYLQGAPVLRQMQDNLMELEVQYRGAGWEEASLGSKSKDNLL